LVGFLEQCKLAALKEDAAFRLPESRFLAAKQAKTRAQQLSAEYCRGMTVGLNVAKAAFMTEAAAPSPDPGVRMKFRDEQIGSAAGNASYLPRENFQVSQVSQYKGADEQVGALVPERECGAVCLQQASP
jgi:hypothetical protein